MKLKTLLAISAIASANIIISPPMMAQQVPPYPVFPEEDAYCQPARQAMLGYFAGTRDLNASIGEAQSAAKLCETSNRLGYHLSMAQIAALTNQPAAAIRFAEAALVIAPEHPEALRRICQTEPNYAKAIDSCRRAVAAAPNSTLAHRALGDRLRVNKDYQGSIASYDRSLSIMANHFAARINRAVSLVALKQYAAALADLDIASRQISATHPDASVIAQNKATALAGLNRPTDAIQALNLHLKAVPKDDVARLQLGQLLGQSGKWKESYTECTAVFLRNGNNLSAFRCAAGAADKYNENIQARYESWKKLAAERTARCSRPIPISTGKMANLKLTVYERGGRSFLYTVDNEIRYEMFTNERVKVNFDVKYESNSTNIDYFSAGIGVKNDLLWNATPQEKAFYNGSVLAALNLYSGKGYPIRVEIISGGLAFTTEEADDYVYISGAKYETEKGVNQKAAVIRKIAETGQFKIRIQNVRTGEVLLNRFVSVPGFAADRRAISQGFEALRLASPGQKCVYIEQPDMKRLGEREDSGYDDDW